MIEDSEKLMNGYWKSSMKTDNYYEQYKLDTEDQILWTCYEEAWLFGERHSTGTEGCVTSPSIFNFC